MTHCALSIILPARNEASTLDGIVPEIRSLYPAAEIIVVDDGSSDETAHVARSHKATVISHPYSMGNGAAIKTGARAAHGDVLVFMDSDGQHRPKDIAIMLTQLDVGYDMVVGARRVSSQAGIRRAIGNGLYNILASWMTGHKIDDLTSGFRAVKADKFKKFLYLLPNGFSYPTTITMAFLRSAFPVTYVAIHTGTRQGSSSSISLIKDGIRFFLIILKIGTLFSPMRLFLPVSLVFFITGASYYSYTYITQSRLTIMSALLFIASMLTFLIGIVSEQVSSLHYKNNNE